MFLILGKQNEVENGWRLFLDNMYQNTRTDGWNEDDFAPDGLEIVSPSTIVISSALPPSVDVYSQEMGDSLATAYANFMTGEGPKEVYGVFKVESSGTLALEFSYLPEEGADFIEDFWDYQGKVSGKVKIRFLDKPLENAPEGLHEGLRHGFFAQGYSALDPKMNAFEEILEPLRYAVSFEVLDLASQPVVVPLPSGKSYTLSLEDFKKALMEAAPELYLFW